MINGIGYSPDGLVLAAACGSPPPVTLDQRIYLWDTTTGEVLRTLAGHAGGTTVVQIEPDGRTVVSAGRDATVKFWDLETAALLKTLPGFADPSARAHHPDGQFIAIADPRDASNSAGCGRRRREDDHEPAEQRPRGLRALERRAAARDSGERLRRQREAFQHRDRRVVRTLPGHADGFAQAVAFSVDGSILASGSSYSREIILWASPTVRS